MLTDAQGKLVQRYHHSPFGQVLEGGDAKNRYGFSGKESFDDGKLLDFGPRMMGPEAGRFLGPDPLELSSFRPQSLNRYLYVRNNPLSTLDISGEAAIEEILECGVDADMSQLWDPGDEAAPEVGAAIAESEGEGTQGYEGAKATPTAVPTLTATPNASRPEITVENFDWGAPSGPGPDPGALIVTLGATVSRGYGVELLGIGVVAFAEPIGWIGIGVSLLPILPVPSYARRPDPSYVGPTVTPTRLPY